MRAILGILLVVLFAGCEKYESPTYPKLSGRWVIDGVSFPNLGITVKYYYLTLLFYLKEFYPILTVMGLVRLLKIGMMYQFLGLINL